ncbi:hypothetical protein GCM10023166_21060 [Paeniglutamicibacter cryotolerans]|uniref:Uncharacterized protein n=1 Tax=Paeniglutamicibacter cryotolerans TaxID=670079 RepID=A0A839QU66_9MICC|nr:hypothetical protein [Paeniglutamicibacter cryotolerans]
MENTSKRQKNSEKKKFGTAEYLGLGSLLANLGRFIWEIFSKG